MKRLSTTQIGSILGGLVAIAAIVAAILLVGCTTQVQTEESIVFDEQPWDVEFTDTDIIDISDHYIHFFSDTVYNATTSGIIMYKVLEHNVLKALDERGPYYITKSCVIVFEGSTIVRTSLE